MSRACLRPISGLEVIERCLNRVHREEMVFADLSTKASEDLSGIAVTTFYPAGTRLFAYQQAAGGVFVICGGRVDLFLSREQGKTMDFGIAGPGDMLGLTASVSGKRYHANAEVLESSEIKFIPRMQLLGFLARHGEVALRVVQQLCECFDQTLLELRRKGFSNTTAARFARFLLDCPFELNPEKDEHHIKLSLTHERIAQIVGTRRETVTRIFNDFRKKKILRVDGETIIVTNRAALELIANS
jgi:CRP/FNR family cyclic AMP-dependent transcriptional regulator